MKKNLVMCSLALAAALAFSAPASAAIIDFTGGTVYFDPSGTATTNGATLYGANVDYYIENGFKLDFIQSSGPVSGSFIGPYYGGNNDVIHSHWLSGGLGNVVKIMVTKTDNTAFDLNYFVLTSNTEVGGGAATGNEKAYIHASTDGVNSSYSQLLPPENWGFPSTQVFLGSQFDGIKAFWFEVTNPVDCFGMDNFFIDEPPPVPDPAVPEPASAALLGMAGLSAMGYFGWRRRKQPLPA